MMNCETGFCIAWASGQCRLSVWLRIRGELAIGGAAWCHRLHMRIVGVKRALHCLTNSCSRRHMGLRASPLVFFSSDQLLTDVGPVELWATHLASSKRSGKSTGLLLPPTPPVAKERVVRSRLPHYGDVSCGCGCDPWLEPILSTAAL